MIRAESSPIKTFDLITYSEPSGFESLPAVTANHVTFRRIDPKSWILFSIYHNRTRSKSFEAEFNFDWNDLYASSHIEPPVSTNRKLGSKIDALEGGVFVPEVGYVDLVEIEVRGHMIPIVIVCGNVDQFHNYRTIIESFLSSFMPTEGVDRRSTTGNASPSRTTHEVAYVDDGFVWRGANGLDYVPPLTSVARGAGFPGAIPGIWQNDHQQFTMELAVDGTYASAYASSAASGSVRICENGHWNADSTRLVLRPERASLFSRNRSGTWSETVKEDFGGPRTYDVTTHVLEYSRNERVSRIDGIELNGPPAPWYYSGNGNFSIIFRRTGKAVK